MTNALVKYIDPKFEALKASLLEEIKYKIYYNKYNFPFVIERLEFSYVKFEFKITCTVSNKLQSFFSDEQCLQFVHQAITVELAQNALLFNADCIYTKEETGAKILNMKEAFKSKLFNLLYKYPSIHTATIGYFDEIIIVKDINNQNNLSSFYNERFNNSKTNSALMEANIKLNELNAVINDIKCQINRRQQPTFINKQILKELGNIKYQRHLYEAGKLCLC